MATSSQNIVATSSDERVKEPDDMKEEVIAVGHHAEAVGQSRSFGSESDPPICVPNLYVLGSQTKCYGGYDNFPGEWDDFSLYGNTKELNSKFPGTYNLHATHQFHNGYGYNMQMPCGIYSPVTSSDGVLHSEAGYRARVDRRADPVFQGSQLDGTSSLSSSGRGYLPGNPGGVGFNNQQRVCEGSRSNGLWSDWPKPLDRHHPLSLASQQPRPFYGFGSHSISYKDRTHAHCVDQGGIPGNGSYKLGTNVGDWHGLNHGRHFGLGNGSLCSCRANDNLNEHNRGPRASKLKRQLFTETYLQVDGNRNTLSPGKLHNASYNNPDLIVQCMDAKFFVIKSYSEDNIYKSIKYSVWASTPNGNQKLNTAYHEAKEKLNRCPIFLFFSVNASAQFCGVAEMVGPVDFEKSVDYWQQDKWSGQFPVKWHVIKDVPNSQFRHIVLEYNDNKPVTNSRDTQEVKLEQGVEMLNIFKNYETNISILDDFDYYEDRHKALKERKSREHSSLLVNGTDAVTEKRITAIESNELTEKMSKSFAQVVRLQECSKNASTAARSRGC